MSVKNFIFVFYYIFLINLRLEIKSNLIFSNYYFDLFVLI